MIDIFGFQWEGIQPLKKIKEYFNPYRGQVIAWEGFETVTKALILSKDGALSWSDAEAIARDMATPSPGAGSSAAVLWSWVIHAKNLEGYVSTLIAGVLGVGGAVTGTAISAFLI